MGGTGTVGSGRARGGLQEVNGRLTILDPGVNAEDITGAVDALRVQMGYEALPSGMPAGVKESRKWPASSGAALEAASLSGGLPTINGAALSPDDLKGATFVSVGRDSYALILPIGEGVQATDSTTGQPFVFSFRRLMREYGQ